MLRQNTPAFGGAKSADKAASHRGNHGKGDFSVAPSQLKPSYPCQEN
ncbi:hypothetical protein [Candidatus Chlorohelix sp.]